MRQVGIGVIGPGRIAVSGLAEPVAAEPRAWLAAVASRDRTRAEAYAAAHGVAKAYDDYAALIADPAVDLVYIATPPAFHAEWAIRAIGAGKALLVEKPFAMDSVQARAVHEAAAASGVSVFEAMHAPHHPLFRRVLALVEEGAVGTIRHVEATFDAPVRTDPEEIRWHAELGGGALMDLGVYPLAFVRRLLGEAFRVERVETRFHRGVDAYFAADLAYPGGATARVWSAMDGPFESHLTIVGDSATLHVTNPLLPHRGNEIALGDHREEAPGPTSWTAQLNAICDTLLDGAPFPFPADDYVRSMEAIDRVRAAGNWPASRPAAE